MQTLNQMGDFGVVQYEPCEDTVTDSLAVRNNW